MHSVQLLRPLAPPVGCYLIDRGKGVPSVRPFACDACFQHSHRALFLVKSYRLDASRVDEAAAEADHEKEEGHGYGGLFLCMYRNEYLRTNACYYESSSDDELGPGNLAKDQFSSGILKNIVVLDELMRLLRHLE